MSIDTRTPAELAVAADTEAQLAAGKDPFGDDEDVVAPSISDQAAQASLDLDEENGTSAAAADADPDAVVDPAATAATAATAAADTATTTATTDKPTLSAEALAEVAADKAPEPAPAQAPKFSVASQEAIEADMLALEAEKAEAFQKVMSGDMESKEYTALEASVNRKIGRLQAQSTLAEANAQNADHMEKQALRVLMAASKKADQIDYTADAKAQAQFDTFLDVALADPDNADKPFAEVAQEAHAAVLAFRGIVKAAGPAETPDPVAVAAAAAAEKPPVRTPEAAPLTLRGLPNASQANTGGTLADSLGRLHGADYQAAFSKLTPAQKNAMVDD